jgi:hypothetical protein
MYASFETLSGIRPEIELLLRSARVVLNGATAQRVLALVRQNLDWTYLTAAAAAHGTAPLLYWQLNQHARDAVPAAVLDDLHQQFLANTRRSLLLAGELLGLLKLLETQAIRVIPFKGPTLAAFAYGNLALRQYIDLDLLILPADLPRARQFLASAGYNSGLALTPVQEEAYLASIGQIPLVKNGGVCVTELHTRITPRHFYFPLKLERLWPRLRPLSLGGQDVLALAAEDLLLVLCAHGAKHCWARLGWVCDVAELLRVQPALNWEAVAAEARHLRCVRILLLGLLLAYDLLQAPVPVEMLRQARSAAAVRRLAAQARRRMFDEDSSRLSGLHDALFHLRSRERLEDGLRYALSLALTPTVADWTQRPAHFSFLYPLLRPVRLAGKYARIALGQRDPPHAKT